MNNQSTMTRIMNLLNLAADESATPHERKLAEELAEKLMQKHMIDRMAVERNASTQQKNTIECQDWEIHVDAAGDNSFEYAGIMGSLISAVLTHCGAKVNYNWDYKRREKNPDNKYDLGMDTGTRVFKVVGFPEDLTYAERIWFRVYKEFIMSVNPTWQPGRDKLGYNIYHFQRAGYKWNEIWDLAYKNQANMRAGNKTSNPSWAYMTSAGRTREIPNRYGIDAPKQCPSLKAAVKEYCASIGEEYKPHTQRHQVYRTSFARSYESEIGRRLLKVRKQAQRDDTVDANEFAVALRDTAERVEEEYYRLFPDQHPDARKARRDKMNFEAWLKAEKLWNELTPDQRFEAIKRLIKEEEAAQKRWEREEEKRKRNFYTIRNDPNRVDESAWSRGKEAASRVNLRADDEVDEPATKALT